MAMFSNAEYYEMMLCVGRADGNLAQARELYRERFLEGRPAGQQRLLPSYQCFRDMVTRLHSTGTFHRSGASGRPNTREERAEEVLQLFEDESTTSTRRAGARLGMNHVSVWRVLKDDGQHPYHYRRTQELIPSDFAPRITFCQWYLAQLEADPNFVNRVIWTDEATFTRCGISNIHNEHVWAHVNPRVSRQGNFQHQWRLNVWAGIYNGHVIGPVILPARLNGDNYLTFLQREFEDAIDDIPVIESDYFDQQRDMVFQHDGAPAHFARSVRAHLDSRFPGGWIGRAGPVPWPARSPDITPLDFFLWGFVKNQVYFTDCHTVEDMEQRVRSVFATITPTMVRNATQAISRRARMCVQQGGRHFEPLL